MLQLGGGFKPRRSLATLAPRAQPALAEGDKLAAQASSKDESRVVSLRNSVRARYPHTPSATSTDFGPPFSRLVNTSVRKGRSGLCG